MAVAKAKEAEREEVGETVLRFDREEDYVGLFQYLKKADRDVPRLLYALYRLVAMGRFQSAFILGKLLAGRNVANPTVDLARGIGGIVFGNAAEESEGGANLARSLGSLAPHQLQRFRDQIATPAFQHALGPAIAGSNGGIEARLIRLKRVAIAPDAAPVPRAPASEPVRAAEEPASPPAPPPRPITQRAAQPDALWAPLVEELDLWAETGRAATFWWRDDDACAPTPQLDRLFAVAGRHPVALAVIPGNLHPALGERLAREPQATVLQHGWLHANHIPMRPGVEQDCNEYPDSRDLQEVRREIQAGRTALLRCFGGQALPVFVPPWGVIADRFLPLLVESGIGWVSGAGERKLWTADGAGIRDINLHVAMDGHDPAQAVAALRDHLRARRSGEIEIWEPTGILTHHMMQTPQAYEFLTGLLRLTDGHAAARWLHGSEVFNRDLPESVYPLRTAVASAPPGAGDSTPFEAEIMDLDRRGEYLAIARLLSERRFETADALFSLYRLMTGARFQSAFVIAKVLSGRDIDNPTVDLARAVGGAIFGNATDEEQGCVNLTRSIGRLDPVQQADFRRAVAEPVLKRAMAPEILGGNRELQARLARVRDLILPARGVAAGAKAMQLASLFDQTYFLTEFAGVLRGRYARLGDGCLFYDIDNRRLVTHLQHADWIFGEYDKMVARLDPEGLHRHVLSTAKKEVRDQPILVSPYPRNYYHVTLDCASALRLLGPEHKSVGLGPELRAHPWQRELWQRCLGDRKMVELDGAEIFIDPVIFFNFAAGPGFDFIRGRIGKFARRGRDVVLIVRSGPSTRAAAGAKAGLFAETPAWGRLLAKLGARRVNFGAGELTVSEQIARLNGARVVIGAHGAALTNLVYLNAPIDLIEIADPFMAQRVPYENIARHLGFGFHRIVCTEFDAEGRMIVDAKAVAAIVAGLDRAPPRASKPAATQSRPKPAKPRTGSPKPATAPRRRAR